MSVAEAIIKRLKNVKWEDQWQIEIEGERASLATAKVMQPGLALKLKEMLRNELAGPGGHAGDQLAVRLFNHYLDDSGQTFVLTLDDMKAMSQPAARMSPKGIDLHNKDDSTVNPDFESAWRTAIATQTPQDYSGSRFCGWDDGAISTYTVKYTGKITAMDTHCKWAGTVEYFDRFDLDPRWGWSPSNTQGRTAEGERRTRIGYILSVGTDFDIKSPKANAWQKETDATITLDGTIASSSTPKP
jgi:hypothetical protein